MPNPNKFMSQPCLKCGGETQIKDVRPLQNGDVTRRRECLVCGYRHTTIEIVYGPHPRCREVAQWASEQNRGIFDGTDN